MCMDSLSSDGKKLRSYKQRYGWKIFMVDTNKNLCFEYYRHNNSIIVPRRKWIKTHKTCTELVYNGDNKRYSRYPLRFHIYLQRPTYGSDDVVCKVRWKGPVAVGYQDGLPVVVANQLKVN